MNKYALLTTSLAMALALNVPLAFNAHAAAHKPKHKLLTTTKIIMVSADAKIPGHFSKVPVDQWEVL